MIKDFSGWSEGAIQKTFFKFSSDHLLIVLSLNAIPLGPWPFKFFNAWCEHPCLGSAVKEEWDRHVELEWNFLRRLKVVKGVVKRCQQEQYSFNEK